MAKNDKEEIGNLDKKKLILAEGVDAKFFLIHLLHKKRIDDIKVLNFGGIKELTKFICTLKSIEGFDDVSSIIIFRDSEKSAQSASESINDSIKTTNLITRIIKPFTISNQNGRNIGFGLFPGIDENGKLYEDGTLEHLCLRLFTENSNNAIIKTYIEDFQTKNAKFRRAHKNELHALFSFTDKYVGLKIGETARDGGFDFVPFLRAG